MEKDAPYIFSRTALALAKRKVESTKDSVERTNLYGFVAGMSEKNVRGWKGRQINGRNRD